MKKTLLKSALMAMAGVGLMASGAMAYTITSYTSYTSWLLAVDPTGDPDIPIVENFEDTDYVPGFSITELGTVGSIHDGVYENIVDANPLSYQIFNYTPGMTAFGAWLDLKNPGGMGTSINVVINDNNQFVFNIPNTAAGEFYGFTVSDGSFTGVRFEDGGGEGIQETYYGVDVAFAPVPEPATMLLFGTGLAGLAGIARRRKK